jgi:hypothetical protein
MGFHRLQVVSHAVPEFSLPGIKVAKGIINMAQFALLIILSAIGNCFEKISKGFSLISHIRVNSTYHMIHAAVSFFIPQFLGKGHALLGIVYAFLEVLIADVPGDIAQKDNLIRIFLTRFKNAETRVYIQVLCSGNPCKKAQKKYREKNIICPLG